MCKKFEQYLPDFSLYNIPFVWWLLFWEINCAGRVRSTRIAKNVTDLWWV